LQPTPQSEPLTKTLQQYQSPEVSQVGIRERKLQCSQAFWHAIDQKIVTSKPLTQSSLKVGFVSKLQKEQNTLYLPEFLPRCTLRLRFFEVKTAKLRCSCALLSPDIAGFCEDLPAWPF